MHISENAPFYTPVKNKLFATSSLGLCRICYVLFEHSNLPFTKNEKCYEEKNNLALCC